MLWGRGQDAFEKGLLASTEVSVCGAGRAKAEEVSAARAANALRILRLYGSSNGLISSFCASRGGKVLTTAL